MSKLIVEKIQKNSSAAELTLPSSDGASNEVIQTDGG